MTILMKEWHPDWLAVCTFKTNTGVDLGGVQGVHTPPEMTCGFLVQLVFCQTMWFIGVEVEQEKSAPPPKKNPGSTPAIGHFTVVGLVSSGCKESQFYSLPFGQAVASMY